MDKNYFLNLFEYENEFLLAAIWDDLNLCLDISFPVITNYFVPPQIWKILDNISSKFNLKLKLLGLNEECEKKLVIFLPTNYAEFIETDIIFFKIDGTNKFKTLTHKDFLGTIMSLGLKRETLGDIIVKDNIAYSITLKDTYDIIKKEISHINKIPVTFSECSKESVPKLEFKIINETTSSLRLDSIIASILNLSRSLSTNLIENGDVSLNYLIEKDKSKTIKENDIITIRKKGKFLFCNINGETKKGKLKIAVKQYI